VALVGNGVRLGLSNPQRLRGGAQAGTVQRSGWGMHGAARNLWAGEGTVIAGASIANKSAIPDGHRPPSAWVMAPKPGGLGARNELLGSGSLVGAIAGGLNAEVDLAGAASTSASLGALAGLVASLAGSGNASATLSGLVEIAALLVGSGAMSAQLGLIVGATVALAGLGELAATGTGGALIESAMAGDGSLVALLTATSDVVASLTGSGAMSATPSALGQMSAAFTVAGAVDPLSPGALAAAVWNSLAASFNNVGTMGEALNSGGGGGGGGASAAQVWAAVASANATPGSMGEALRQLFLIAGLDPANPMVTDGESRRVPADGSLIDQTVITVGDTTTVTTEDP
jgi:hypothetical protein